MITQSESAEVWRLNSVWLIQASLTLIGFTPRQLLRTPTDYDESTLSYNYELQKTAI